MADESLWWRKELEIERSLSTEVYAPFIYACVDVYVWNQLNFDDYVAISKAALLSS